MTDATRPANLIRSASPLDFARPGQSAGEARLPIIILTLPEAVQKQTQSAPVTIIGEITAQKPDGTITIKTPAGDITARSEKPLHLATGERVEISLTAQGDAQQTATLRAGPEAPRPQRPATPPQEQLPPQATPLPPKQTVQQVIEAALRLSLKPIPPAQIAAVIKPYLTQLSAALPQPDTLNPRLSPLDISPQASALKTLLPPANTTQAVPFFATEQNDLPALLTWNAPIAEKPPLPLSFITPAQGIMDILKSPSGAVERAIMTAALMPTPILRPTIFTTPALQLPVPEPQTTTLQQIAALVLPEAPLAPPPRDTTLPLFRPDLTAPFNLVRVIPPAITMIPIESKAPPTPTPMLLTAQPQPIVLEVVGYTPELVLPVLRPVNSPAQPSSPMGLFTLDVPLEALPLGTRLEVQIVPPATPQVTPLSQASIPTLALGGLAAPLLAVTDIQTTLQTYAPALAARLNATLPNPAQGPQQFGPAALFFLAALRSGDVSSWLGGPAVDTLKRLGKGDLITRLAQDTQTQGRTNEPGGQDWRLTHLPLSWNQEIHKIPVYSRREERNGEETRGQGGQTIRFVMSLSLSALGDLQIDGLYQKPPKGPARLDVILRSGHRFPAHDQAAMRALYTDALAETGISGELSFQTNTSAWVHIKPDHHPSFSEKI